MKTEPQIKEKLAEVEADERLHYPTATVFNNAPLALIQMSLETQKELLNWILEERDNASN